MKKRTKLLSLLAGVAASATLAVAPAFGDNGESYVVVSDHYYGTIQIWVTEYDKYGGIIHRKHQEMTNGALYWNIDSNAAYVLVEGGNPSGDLPDTSLRVPSDPNQTLATQPNALPACFRIDSKKNLKWISESCNKDGVGEGSWGPGITG